MIRIEINPDNLEHIILKNLNICFPNWGNEIHYRHFFKKAVTDIAPDIIVFRNESHEIIAGSAVSYRKIRWTDGNIYDIGIMTGSWTLPAARGMGCFSQMIQTSKEICQNRKVDYLTAFVTEDNASYRRLKEAGYLCLPANNYFLESSSESKTFDVEEISLSDLFNENNGLENVIINQVGFHYDTTTFLKQYLQRLFPRYGYKFNDVIYVVEVSHIVKILFTSKVIPTDLRIFANWLGNHFDKNIMFFNTQSQNFENLEKFMKVKPGFFTILECSEMAGKVLADTTDMAQPFTIQLGDKV